MNTELLKLFWATVLPEGEPLTTTDGRTVVVVSRGEENSGVITGAKISIGEESLYGSVVIDSGKEIKMCGSDIILAVTADSGMFFCYEDGSRVVTLAPEIPRKAMERLSELRSGSGPDTCGGSFASMDPAKCVSLITALLVDRLKRNLTELMIIHRENGQDWNCTLYTMLFRAMAGNVNKDKFIQLSQIVPYKAIARERGELQNIEALLLGAAGLLYGHDEEYVRNLNATFEHLQRKYSLRPMHASVWSGKGYPAGSPTLRLAQLASFFTHRDFLFDRVMKCRKCDDLYPVFLTEASEFWTTHYSPDKITTPRSKSIGRGKAESLGINLVVPLMFAYGKDTQAEHVCENALQLLESIPCEQNAIVDQWRKKGMDISNAFDSQAIIELNNQYCLAGRCTECRLGKRTLVEALR